MKKLLIMAIVLLLAFPSLSIAAAGTCTQTVYDLPDTGPSPASKTIVFVCIASADAATFPATTVTTNSGNLARILGYDITECRTYPGAVSATSLTSTGTNPTALYDVAITDQGGLSLITITDAAAATPASDIPALKAGVYGGRTILDAPVFAVTGNLVNSANIVVRCVLKR